MTQKEKFNEWVKNNPEEYSRLLDEHMKKTQICFHCWKSIYPIVYKDWAYLKDFKTIDKKPLYVCREHATQEIYETYKNQYFVESYRGSKIYFYNDLFIPYFNADYGYKNLDDCRNKIDHPELIAMNMSSFYELNNHFLFYKDAFYKDISNE